MIDIHCHLLPGVDDGPGEMEQSLAMAEQAVKDGISGIIVTPHILGPLNSEFATLCLQRFEELNKAVKERGLNLRLFLGSEILFQFNMLPICRQKLGTLAGNGKYTLIEFPLDSLPYQFEEQLFELQLAGFIPIIAHPERNMRLINNTEKIIELHYRGILFQVNARSLTGQKGRSVRKLVERLVSEEVAQFVASDAHDTAFRPLILSQAKKAVEKLAGEELAEKIFHLNPQRMLKGEKILD